MSKKPTVAAAVSAAIGPSKDSTVTVPAPVAFATPKDAVLAMCAVSESAANVAARLRAMLKVPSGTDIPGWDTFNKHCESVGIELRKSQFVPHFAAMWDTEAEPERRGEAKDTAGRTKARVLDHLAALRLHTMSAFVVSTKGATCGEDASLEYAYKQVSDALSKYIGGKFRTIKSADRDGAERMARNASTEVDVIKRVMTAQVQNLPAIVADMVEAELDVPKDIRQLAAAIVKLKLCNPKRMPK